MERKWSGAGRKRGERKLSRSGDRTFQKTLEQERSEEREAAEGNGAESAGCHQRLERSAANWPLRSGKWRRSHSSFDAAIGTTHNLVLMVVCLR